MPLSNLNKNKLIIPVDEFLDFLNDRIDKFSSIYDENKSDEFSNLLIYNTISLLKLMKEKYIELNFK
jgi:hypothetical protein